MGVQGAVLGSSGADHGKVRPYRGIGYSGAGRKAAYRFRATGRNSMMARRSEIKGGCVMRRQRSRNLTLELQRPRSCDWHPLAAR